jgi:hypothetical protein
MMQGDPPAAGADVSMEIRPCFPQIGGSPGYRGMVDEGGVGGRDNEPLSLISTALEIVTAAVTAPPPAPPEPRLAGDSKI